MNVNCVVSRSGRLCDQTGKIYLETPLAWNNALAHAMRYTALDDVWAAADLTGIGVTGSFLRADGETVEPINGTVTGNVAEVILPPACYIVPGHFKFTMHLTDQSGAIRSVMWVEGTVERNTSTAQLDPGTPISNISQAIGQANAAASAASAAAETATQAAAAAQEVADNVEGKVGDLKSHVSSMNTATSEDEGKALKAKTVENGVVTEWEFGEAGGIDPADIDQAVEDYLDAHPEKTTTVQDGSITSSKFSSEGKEWIRGKFVYNVCDYGAYGDGVHDDAPAIRNAISDLPEENWILYFPPGVYLQGDGTNTQPCHFKLFTEKKHFEVSGYGATIIANPLNACIPDNGGFKFDRCEYGVIKGLTYNGSIEDRKPSMGDDSSVNDQSAFKVSGGSYISFVDCTAIGSCMDGFVVGRGDTRTPTYEDTAKYVKLIRCVSKYSYRQGLSVVQAHHGLIDGCEFSYTGTIYGTLPKDGIDFEAGNPFDGGGQSNWIVRNSTFIENAGGGIEFLGKTWDCIVDGCRFKNNAVKVYTNAFGSTRNIDILNSIFDGSAVWGNCGTRIIGNKFYDCGVATSADTYNWFDDGKCRIIKIDNNYFEFNFDIEQETYNSSNVISTSRRFAIFENNATEFTNNVVVNSTGSVVYVASGIKILKFTGNVFKSNIVPAEGKYLGSFITYPVSASEKENNKLDSIYYLDGTSHNALYNTPDMIEISVFSKNPGSYPYLVISAPVTIARLNVKCGREELTYNRYTNSYYRISRADDNGTGISYLTLKMSPPVSIDNRYVVVISGFGDAKTVDISIRFASTLTFEQRATITAEQVNTLPSGATLIKPHPTNVRLTALPDLSEWYFNAGAMLMYNSKIVAFYNNKFYYADGTEAT